MKDDFKSDLELFYNYLEKSKKNYDKEYIDFLISKKEELRKIFLGKGYICKYPYILTRSIFPIGDKYFESHKENEKVRKEGFKTVLDIIFFFLGIPYEKLTEYRLKYKEEDNYEYVNLIEVQKIVKEYYKSKENE